MSAQTTRCDECLVSFSVNRLLQFWSKRTTRYVFSRRVILTSSFKILWYYVVCSTKQPTHARVSMRDDAANEQRYAGCRMDVGRMVWCVGSRMRARSGGKEQRYALCARPTSLHCCPFRMHPGMHPSERWSAAVGPKRAHAKLERLLTWAL